MRKQFRLKKYYLILILLLFLSSCFFKPDPAKVEIIAYEAPTTEKQWKSDCNNPLCRSLLNLINEASQSLDIAVYGVREQPKINQALLNALDRGVKIRLVYDQPLIGENYYQIKQHLNPRILKQAVHDTGDAIMHNKFIIADRCKIWTGSANLSDTGIGGYNANIVALIDSCYLGTIYEKEFSQLYAGQFNIRKKKIESRKIELESGGYIQVFFSPQSNTVERAVIPLLKKAQETINIPIFYLTHDQIFEALKQAQSEGVKIKVILDATAAENEYVLDEQLREAGIPIKVENWPGKMHMKVAIIDNRHLITGSMNFTKAGNSKNDENTVILWNVPELAKPVNRSFFRMWQSIPRDDIGPHTGS